MTRSNRNSVEVLPDGMTIRSNIEEFSAEELIRCNECGRKNSPNRENCIYCGNPLKALASTASVIEVAAAEPWQNGVNVAVKRSADSSPGSLVDGFPVPGSKEKLEALFEQGGPRALPFIRAANTNGLITKVEEIKAFGLDAFLVNDHDLDLDRPPRRLRKIDVHEDSFVLHDFNTMAQTTVKANELVAVVSGVIVRSVESVLKMKKKDENPEIDRVDADRRVLDLYAAGDPVGFRVEISGFDFSGLGSNLALTGKENFERLVDRLRETAGLCFFDSNYERIRHLLGDVWIEDSVKDHHGIKRIGVLRAGRATSVVTNNEIQFTRYSRLQYISL